MNTEYIIHRKKLISLAKEYSQIAPIIYPVKVNSQKTVIDLIDKYVFGYEVDSYELLEFLLLECGIASERIIFSSLINDEDTIRKVVLFGIKRFVVDDFKEIKKIIDNSNEIKKSFLVRIDVTPAVKANEHILKWGSTIEEYESIRNYILSTGNNCCGISFYLPQEINTIENFERVLSFLASNIDFSDAEYIDIGGGISIGDCNKVVSILREKISNMDVGVLIEPGRHFVGSCIDLRCKVKSIRERNDNSLVFLDCGIYNGFLDCIIKNHRFNIINPITEGKLTKKYIVCGSTSDISDVIGEYFLPESLKEGDYVIFEKCGAYCSEMSTEFAKTKKIDYIIDPR